MSKIDAQIQALLLKKKKIDYVSYVADLIKNDTKCIDFKDVQKEIVEKIEPFLLDLMTAIETDSEVQKKTLGSDFTDDQKNALKLVADKVLTKPTQPQSTNSGAFSHDNPQTPKKVDAVSHHDKMSFALNNRHLGNKKVQVINDKNVQIFGTVVGLDAPFVVVKTDTGPTINVPLEKIVLA